MAAVRFFFHLTQTAAGEHMETSEKMETSEQLETGEQMETGEETSDHLGTPEIRSTLVRVLTFV